MNVALDNQVFQCLSDAKLGPHCYYMSDYYRVEAYLDVRLMGVWEMRNPYYVHMIIDKIIMYNNNAKVREVVEEHYKGEKVTWLSLFKDKFNGQFRERV